MTDRDGWLGMSRGGSGMWMAANGNASSARVAARREEDLTHASSNPQVPAFWARDGGGHPILLWIAAAHAATGLFGATAGVLVWLFVAPKDAQAPLAALAGAGVAVAAVFAFQLARSPRADAATMARGVLPAADLVACGVVLWLLGDIGLASLLFVVPIGVAALLLSWRSGATFAALAVATFAALNALRLGSAVGEWVPQTLALAGIAILFAVCVGIFSAQLTEIIVSLSWRFTRLHDQRAAQGQEQARLLEGLNLLEEAQARLEQERAAVNAQISELADAARRMSEGDLAAARGLHPGMYGPLDILAAALVRLSQQMASALSARQQLAGRQYALDSLSAATREQAQMLASLDASLRELGLSANDLVAEVQRVGRGSGELLGGTSHVLLHALAGVERHAQAQASNTSILASRLAQTRARQAGLDGEIQRLSQLAAIPQSGELVSRSAAPPSAPANFDASGVLPPDTIRPGGARPWPALSEPLR
jgi:hypothetical protein